MSGLLAALVLATAAAAAEQPWYVHYERGISLVQQGRGFLFRFGSAADDGRHDGGDEPKRGPDGEVLVALLRKGVLGDVRDLHHTHDL